MASLVEVHGHAGDEGNFEALYRTYKSEVHRLASYLLRNTADAEDASQTVFLNVLRALRQGVAPADPRAWLLAITRNVCFSRRRAAASRPDEVELDAETLGRPEGDGGPSADDIVGALARMLPNQRTALILRDFRGVPRIEISELLRVSPTGVEALLTRARSRFREELEAGGRPFDCAETKALVEQQLEGSITVSERHSLRAHLRHCSPCSTLARAVRSSRGKLASLLPWCSDWISRLAAAFSQAPTAMHVVGAISSTAIVASVAIPAALVHGPGAAELAAQPAPAAVAATRRASSAEPWASRAGSGSQVGTGKSRVLKAAARAHGHAGGTARAHAAKAGARSAAKTTRATAAPTPSSPATAAPATSGSEPRTASPVVTQPYAAAPGTAPRSTSPAARPTGKAKPKPARRATNRHGTGRHPTDPADRMSGSTPPAAALPPPAGGAVGGSGPGFTAGSSSAPAAASTTQATSADTGSDSSSSTNNSGSGKGHHKHNK